MDNQPALEFKEDQETLGGEKAHVGGKKGGSAQ
jgi:hypothetical protein